MAYTIRQYGTTLQVFNAMSGANLFSINAGGTIQSWNISGETVTIYYVGGRVSVWNLSTRSIIR